jgi:hypothetical protein
MVYITVVMLNLIVSTHGVTHKINTRHYIRALNVPPDTPARLRSVTGQLAASVISGLRRYHLSGVAYILYRDIQIFLPSP